MVQIKLKSLHIQNFKGCKNRMISFGEKTRITGANESGKTTIFDSFMWLLFGKDSLGSSDFDIRPLDKDGKMIDNVEISVEAEITADGEEYELKKLQKQRWVKKRGTDTREFQGNVNEFEINGYPKSQKEFKEFISGIVDEDVFNLITNPAAFNALPWKKQRKILMKFVGSFSDVEIAEVFDEKYKKLIPELKIAGTDDILKKYAKAKGALSKNMVEIPARIDEISKQLVIADVGALEVEKAAKEAELKKVEEELTGGNSKLEEINSKREEVIKLKFHLSEIQNAENQKLLDGCAKLREEEISKEDALKELNRKISIVQSTIRESQLKYQMHDGEVKSLIDAWKTEKARTFPVYVPLDPLPESATVCPTCGQELPEDLKQKNISGYESRKKAHEEDYAKKKAAFDKTHEENLKQIVENGNKASASRDEYKAKEESFSKSLDELNSKLSNAEAEYVAAKEKVDAYPRVADVSQNEEYKSTFEKIKDLENEIESMSKESSGRTELEAKRVILKDEITEIAGKILASDNTKIKERIAELEAEQKEIGQKVAEQEQMIDLMEDFIRAKMNMISEKINGMFKVVSFKLFDNQINGGLKETCECTVNGVPLSSLNNGHRIIAGLDIIQSMSNLYGVSCPVFIDNSEAVNEFNFPEMDSQMIYLAVTDEKELKVESEDK
nr:AAA family ATPase [uncultured Mediterraneibacter sp.]